ncbi:MAG TPA: protein kinase, partial [Ktedonobacteraceae bacterium]|nr:protein kinase [Ktedonobacteraceae bacterium]
MLMEHLFCQHCGAANLPGNATCHNCQHALEDVAETPQPINRPILQDRYRLCEQIGTGGYGAVYRAEDLQKNQRTVAIKSINLKGLSSQEIIEATDTYNREVGLLTTLAHPNLPRIYSQFSDTEHWYVAMEFIAGETLEDYFEKQRLRSRQPGLPLEEIIDIARQLCDVLHYLHSQQPPIIFRDLKPGNIMLTPNGKVYLIDFGIARRFTPGKRKDTIPLGSPGFAAPEQYGKEQTGPQADVYSLGALLHHLFTGHDPADNPFSFSSVELAEDALRQQLDLLLVKMVEKDRSKRIQGTEEVKRRLQHLVAIQEALQPQQWHANYATPTTQQTYKKPTKHSRRDAMIAFTLAGFGIAVIGGGAALSALSDVYTATPTTAGGMQPAVMASSQRPPMKVIDPSTHTKYLFKDPQGKGIRAISWWPDGQHVLTAAYTMNVWELPTRKIIHTYVDSDRFQYTASPDGKQVAFVNGPYLMIGNSITGQTKQIYADKQNLTNI